MSDHNGVQALALEYGFELIPDCPAATAAGYTAADRALAQVWLGLGEDKENFYYTAWSGSIFALRNKASILIARRKKDGNLVYAIDCSPWTLDTGASFVGKIPLVARVIPAVDKNNLFLTSATLSNIGPQLFCVDTCTGALKWAIAYRLPEAVKTSLGVNYLTARSDYSAFKGSNAALGDLNPVVRRTKTCGGCSTYRIYLGASSLQNVYNPGLIPGTPYYIGYPYYTDRGALSLVEVVADYPALVATTETCVRPLVVGETITKSGVDNDPFLPNATSVQFITVVPVGQPIVKSSSVGGVYPVLQRVERGASTPTTADVSTFWAALGSIIYVVNAAGSTGPFDLATALTNTQPGVNYLYASPASNTFIETAVAGGQFGVSYVKELLPGDVVLNKYDANGLGYWGNSVWGNEPDLVDDKGVIYFGSGQAHAIPLSERLYFADPSRDYRTLKVPLVDAISAFTAAPSADKLNTVNQLKVSFYTTIRQLSLATSRSPRGQRSYSDGMFGSSSVNLRILFGLRTIPCDVYSFIGKPFDLTQYFGRDDIDGDVSSGLYYFPESNKVLTATKGGVGVSLSIHKLTRVEFDHYNLDATGVVVGDFVYVGPNNAIGAVNYNAGRGCNSIYFTVFGDNRGSGSRGSNQQLEQYVLADGTIIPLTGATVTSFSGKIGWNYQLPNLATGNCAASEGIVYAGDTVGRLYALDAKCGDLLWFQDTTVSEYPMPGGSAAPLISCDKVYWISSYAVPLTSIVGGKYGNVYARNKCLAELPVCGDFLVGRVFHGQTGITHTWLRVGKHLRLKVDQPGYSATLPAYYCEGSVSFDTPLAEAGTSLLNYTSATFLNKEHYTASYIDVSNGNTPQTIYMQS